MAVAQLDFPEETLESEFLDQSLSVWKGKGSPCYGLDDFKPVPLDLHTACSIGYSNIVRLIIDRSHLLYLILDCSAFITCVYFLLSFSVFFDE